MHTSSAAPDTGTVDVQRITTTIPTSTLGWRDLPADTVVTVQYAFSTTSLLELGVRYQGTDWSFTIRDPVYSVVSLTAEQARDRDDATRRALKAALDQVGIRLVEHPESGGQSRRH